MFELITPLSYWILTFLWLAILCLYLAKLRHLRRANATIAVLLTILALDAFRTLFESTYFGLYFNSQFGLLPAGIGATLGRPELLIIPKLINIIAGVLVLFLLIRRWIPREIDAGEHRNQQLQKSEELYRDFVEGSNDVVTRTNPEGRFTFVNFKAQEIFGLPSSECIGLTAMEFVHVDDRKKLMDAFAAWTRDKPRHVTHENRQVSRSGEIRDLLWTVSPHFDESGRLTHMNNAGRDITERKRAKEQQQLLAMAVDQTAESIVITGIDGSIEYVNSAFETHLGYSREEAFREIPLIIQSAEHDRALVSSMQDTLSSGRIWAGRVVTRSKDGSLFDEEATISPVHDADGNITNYVSVTRDVTREAELEARLVQSQKMEAIGTLAGGIAHDFNNLLQVMLGYLDLARAETATDSLGAQRLDKIRIAGERATHLVDQILAFSHRSELERKPLQLQPILNEALKLLRASIPSTIEIRESIAADSGPVMADATEMHQIVMNLCTNAYHAMREHGGVLEVTLDEVAMDSASASRIPGLEEGRKVRLSVRDTGTGMAAASLERIFDPYFTTKSVGDGTGLGLATVRGIVEGCEGAVTVESELGVGTRFEVYFPLATRRADGEETKVAAGALPTGSERLLVVDDEPMVAEQARLGLESFGYVVEAHTGSLEALEAFRTAPHRFDVVITDQTMPNMTGLELARELLLIEPNLPIILCTGFSELVSDQTARAAGIRKYVKKPVLPRSLAAEIRKIMGTRQRIG
jgi:PAS domain S-box-containing protein